MMFLVSKLGAKRQFPRKTAVLARKLSSFLIIGISNYMGSNITSE